MSPSPWLTKPRDLSFQNGTADDLLSDPEEPLYLLSLDGGGVRGISEAVILHEIMLRIQKKLALPELPRPCEYFHLIGGTSTGGLIAIMLGRMRMSTREVIHEYETIAKQIFSHWNRRPDFSFRKTKLEQCVKSVAAARVDKNDGRMISNNDGIKTGLSFVVSLRKAERTNVNTPTLFRTYKGKMSKSPDCEIWEAARATTAAPRFFAPARITIEGEKQYFLDGALKWNNPAHLVLEEAESHFGPHRVLGCLVSLGTGLRPSPLKGKGGGTFGKSYSVSEVVKMLSDMITDTEAVHQTIEGRLKGHPDNYFRFTVPCIEGEDKIKIHEHKRMKALREITDEYLKKKSVSDKLNELVDVLTTAPATELTLQEACHATSTETSMAQVAHRLQHRKTTSPIFTGREDVLDVLDDWFYRRPPGSYPRRDFCLWGIAGIGKTQIALHFADVYRPRFDRVLWVDASMVFHSYEMIASDVLERPPKGRDLIPAVVNWLESTDEEWLLIVDNYDSGDISSALPGYGKGNILFTSRRNDIVPDPVYGRVYTVPEMSLTDSTTLLLRAARLDEHSRDLRRRSKPLVEEMGSLPIALNQAGAFIRHEICSIEQCLDAWRQNKKVILQNPKYKGSTEHEITVNASFDLSLKRLRNFAAGSSDDAEKAMAYKSALEILNIFCFFHHQNIPAEIIARAHINLKSTGRWDEIWEPVDIVDDESIQSSGSTGRESTESREAIENIFLGMCPSMSFVDLDYLFAGILLLMQFSLLDPVSHKGAIYRIHPLVHSWLRDRMDPDTYNNNFQLARTILFHAYSPSMNDVSSERFHRSLMPHMQANNSFLVKSRTDSESSLTEMEITFKYATALRKSKRWEEAIPLLEQTIRDLSREFDLCDSQTLANMLTLGRTYMDANRIGDAVNIYKEVMDRAPSCLNNPQAALKYVVSALGELSMVYLVKGIFDLAYDTAEDALAMAEKNRLGLSPHRARLCLMYQYQMMWEEAEELQVSLLKTRMGRRTQGPEHHKTLRTIVELAGIRARLGKMEEAAQDLARAVAKLEKELGPRSLDTLVAKSELAWTHHLRGGDGFEKAEELQKGALRVSRFSLGDKHPYTLLMIMRLGLTLEERGRFGKSMELFEECERGRKEVFGPEHIATAGTAAAQSLMRNRIGGGRYLEELGIPPEKIEMMEMTKSLAQFPYMYVQM